MPQWRSWILTQHKRSNHYLHRYHDRSFAKTFNASFSREKTRSHCSCSNSCHISDQACNLLARASGMFVVSATSMTGEQRQGRLAHLMELGLVWKLGWKLGLGLAATQGLIILLPTGCHCNTGPKTRHCLLQGNSTQTATMPCL